MPVSEAGYSPSSAIMPLSLLNADAPSNGCSSKDIGSLRAVVFPSGKLGSPGFSISPRLLPLDSASENPSSIVSFGVTPSEETTSVPEASWYSGKLPAFRSITFPSDSTKSSDSITGSISLEDVASFSIVPEA